MGTECDTFTIDPMSNCTGSICRHEFDVPSWCSNVTNNISVVVSTTNSDTSINFWTSETIEIGTLNRFVDVSVDMRGSGENFDMIITLLYIDQLSNVTRYYDIEYGPDCRNLYPLEGNYVTNNKPVIVKIDDIDLSYLGNSTEFCVSVVAETGYHNKRVRTEGMYDINKQNHGQETDIEIPEISTTTHESAFQVQMSFAHVGSIGLLVIIIIIYVF